jgi:HK97 family phage portal protein
MGLQLARKHARAAVRSAFAQKQVVPPGANAGWASTSMGFGTGAGLQLGAWGSPRRVSRLVSTYGGTDDATWTVFACASLIAATGASYEHNFVDPDTRVVIENPPSDLSDLFKRPAQEITYFDWMEDVWLDLELIGNSYWYKSQRNGLGQPLELLRLDPATLTIVLDKAGRKAGYVMELQGQKVPYTLDEIIHYRYRNPLNPHYGMGTVEALIREIEADITESAHVTAFFTNGARIAGILTVSDTLNETQFERLKAQFHETYGGAQNAYKTLLAEQAASFTPVSQPPPGSGVIELRRLQKDAILSGFGVPAVLLGGILENANYKMEEAQHVFDRAMYPKAQRVQERTEIDLCSFWDIGFQVKPETAVPMGTRIERAKNMTGTGATINELRATIGWPPLDSPLADVPLLFGNVAPWLAVVADKLPPELLQPPARFGMDPTATQQSNQTGGANVETGQPPALPPSNGGGQANNSSTNAPASANPSPPSKSWDIGSVVNAVVKQLTGASPAMFTEEPVAGLVIPTYPAGYEQLTDVKDTDPRTLAAVQEVLDGQSRFLHLSTDRFRQAVVGFFIEQQRRVLDRLNGAEGLRWTGGHGSARALVNAKAQHWSIEDLFPKASEDAALRQAYALILDTLGPDAVQLVARVVTSGTITWGPNTPALWRWRNKLASQVTRVNDVTRGLIAEQVELGVARGYSVTQIANGFPKENYPGIAGVFDEATAARAETIARTETAYLWNGATIGTYRTAGIGQVYVSDGTGDSACDDANGSVWSLDRADSDPLGHPNCVRSFAPYEGGAGALAVTATDTKDVGDKPWHVVSDSSQCPASKPYAVVVDATGEVVGCHATRSDADDHVAALYSNAD